ncbi:MAG: MarR family transcriptional regulator [Polyangiaceae bacterium]
MRPLIFSFKRFVLMAGRLARKLAEVAGLTPARLDLLLRLRARPAWQSELVLDMCVHPSVTSRMLKALEALGLVRRFKDERDRRQRIVWLTDHALIALSDLWEAEFPDLPELEIQSSAEHEIALHWNPRAQNEGFALAPFDADNDREAFLRDMHSTVLRTDYRGWIPGDRDPPRSRARVFEDPRGPMR